MPPPCAEPAAALACPVFRSTDVLVTFNSPPQIGPAQRFTRTATVKPVTGQDGTVSLHISQLFPGALQLGQFDIRVIGPGGREATTRFIVIPIGA